jgi:hypothetical protein
MEQVKTFKVLPGYRLEVEFQNGKVGELQREKNFMGRSLSLSKTLCSFQKLRWMSLGLFVGRMVRT